MDRNGLLLPQFFGLLALFAGLALGWVPVRAQSILQYHSSADRAGNYVVPAMTPERARSVHFDSGFDGRVDGHVYAQPLIFNGDSRELLVVATENDVIDALDARTGKVVWHKSLGRSVPSTLLRCGDIDPLGITGTPAIDASRRAIYLDAMVRTDEGPQHLVFGLSLENGDVLHGFPINVTHALASMGQQFVASDQNQRGALLIAHNTVYIAYGGHFGDCGNYRGWIVGIALDDPRRVIAWSTKAEGGGIWAPGGVVFDGRSIFFATGNTFATPEWGGGEAVIRLGFDLRPPAGARDYFAPSNWRILDRQDADLGGTAPIPIDLPRDVQPTSRQALKPPRVHQSQDQGVGRLKDAVHFMIALGKDGKAYLLNRDSLGGIGGAVAMMQVSENEIKTAPASFPARDGGALVVFPGRAIKCTGGSSGHSLGAIEIKANPTPALSMTWCAPLDGAGTPIVTTTDGHSNPIIWITGAEGDNRLHAFRGDNGESIMTTPETPMLGLRHFGPVIATRDSIFVPADGRIYAFRP